MFNDNLRLFIGYVWCFSVSTLIDFALLFTLTNQFHLWYFLSAFISYSSGMIVNYSLNKYLNFKNSSRQVFTQFSIFVSVALVWLALNQIIIYLLVEFAGVWYMLAKIVSICIVVLWSFTGHRKFTFKLLE